MIILDKNLIKLQENHIDIKNNIKKIDNIKNREKNLTWWEKIIKFFKSLLNIK